MEEVSLEEAVAAEDRAEARELQEEASRLTSLISHPGWKYLQDVLAAQVETRDQQIRRTPLKSMDEALEQEYKKGEAAGIDFAASFALVRLNAIKEQLDEMLKSKEGNEDENSAE